MSIEEISKDLLSRFKKAGFPEKKSSNEKNGGGRVVVEVGSGGRPSFYQENDSSGIPARPLRGDEKYVTVNINKRRSDDEQTTWGEGDNFSAIAGDAENLIFPDGTVDELIYTNVFGDPNGPGITMLAEASRVLSENGHITITETLTPEHTYNTLVTVNEQGKIVINNDELAKCGLEAQSVSQNKFDIGRMRSSNPEFWSPNAFTLILKKQQPK